MCFQGRCQRPESLAVVALCGNGGIDYGEAAGVTAWRMDLSRNGGDGTAQLTAICYCNLQVPRTEELFYTEINRFTLDFSQYKTISRDWGSHTQ
jgi:hypothetical protein